MMMPTAQEVLLDWSSLEIRLAVLLRVGNWGAAIRSGGLRA